MENSDATCYRCSFPINCLANSNNIVNFAEKFLRYNGMGKHINIGNAGFTTTRNGEYVDKSGLISVFNQTLNTKRKVICVSRCRRLAKSIAPEMLAAYYDCSCDSC